MDTLRILICDDSLLIRKKFKESLDKCGKFEVLEAADGQEALKVYQEHQPNLVFLDIVMPVLDGITALQEMKKSAHQAKVIMVSSSGTQSHLKKALEAGAEDFIQKPWEHHQIVAVISKLVKERESHV